MYSQQFTLCYFLVKSPLLIRFKNFLRHRSVSGAPPPKKNPASAPDVYFPLYFPAYCLSVFFPSFKVFFKTRISCLSSNDQFVGKSHRLTLPFRKTGNVVRSYGLPHLTTLVCLHFTHNPVPGWLQ